MKISRANRDWFFFIGSSLIGVLVGMFATDMQLALWSLVLLGLAGLLLLNA